MLDGTPIYSVQKTNEALQVAGINMIDRPPYFAEFNPTENMWKIVEIYAQDFYP